MAVKWLPIDGKLEFTGNTISFKGEPTSFTNPQGQEQVGLAIGLAMSNERFSGGTITAQVEFDHINETNACELVFYFDPAKRWFASAGLGGPGTMYFIRHWDGKWNTHAIAGNKANLQPRRRYQVKAEVRGSRVFLSVDDVEVLAATMPFALPPSQAGVHFLDDSIIRVHNFHVASGRAKVFVVMQFSSPFTEIHEDVVKIVCGEFDLEAYKADETYGPGLIIADVVKDIAESEFVIAEITPANPNVYYELGYAHAINKPVVLLADKSIDRLPFDISGFRVLFYENSIPGKKKFEEGLRRHIASILHKDPILGARRT